MDSSTVTQPTTTPKAATQKPPTTKPPATPKAKASPAPDLSGRPLADATEKALAKITGHVVRLKEKRRRALLQLRAAERDLEDTNRQLRLLLRAVAGDAQGAGELDAEPTPAREG